MIFLRMERTVWCLNVWEPIPIGKAVLRKKGSDITIATLGVSMHRALDAAALLEKQGISAGVLDPAFCLPAG